MGNRDALLSAAHSCVVTKGFNHTSARDVTAEAGVSLAAIGYHFGSTEALLTEAVLRGIGDWAQDLGHLLTDDPAPAGETPRERFTRVWAAVLASFEDHRKILAASYAVMARADDLPDVRRRLSEGIDTARRTLATLLAGIDPATDPERTRQVGSLYYAILGGLLTQWLVDPDSTPSATDLTAALTHLRV
ncbi:AcrR family transcriptional regulator [Catenuloplanes nepalensis]|uniref:AcrR family transcriptional regulator n=1 Tax=Catenuloplanes nepalensis TaxID=587533 RepID=A0ABT9MZ08_9ACTN|nr:TetR/AcrR family transcriptional regulator [Catenuloplanes nepalensis]MDP9796685.1 AcrR family transcriptional regulator [Catenuloplanes nepalensis]